MTDVPGTWKFLAPRSVRKGSNDCRYLVAHCVTNSQQSTADRDKPYGEKARLAHAACFPFMEFMGVVLVSKMTSPAWS